MIIILWEHGAGALPFSKQELSTAVRDVAACSGFASDTGFIHGFRRPFHAIVA
jgi:hypothetical protein